MKRRALRHRYGHASTEESAKTRLKREGFEAVAYGNYYRRTSHVIERIIAPWYGGKSGFNAQIETLDATHAMRGFGPASLPACLKWFREQETR
jgi:hypothetical protein